jgi:hypothetical protein
MAEIFLQFGIRHASKMAVEKNGRIGMKLKNLCTWQKNQDAKKARTAGLFSTFFSECAT